MEKTYRVMVFPPTDEEGIVVYEGAKVNPERYLIDRVRICNFVDKHGKRVCTTLPVIIEEE